MYCENHCEIYDLSLAPSGRQKIEWVKSSMPVLASIHERFLREKPLAGLDVSISIHLEAKTAYFAHVLAAAGAAVRVTGCNPLSTQDDVAAALAADGFCVNAFHGAAFWARVQSVLPGFAEQRDWLKRHRRLLQIL